MCVIAVNIMCEFVDSSAQRYFSCHPNLLLCMFIYNYISPCFSLCLSVGLYVCLLVCRPVCLSACLSACMSVCLSVGLYVCLLVCRPVCLSQCLSFYSVSSLFLSLSLSVCRSAPPSPPSLSHSVPLSLSVSIDLLNNGSTTSFSSFLVVVVRC
eukprot:GHVL01042305.1.p1 GENE.GHVL01042305.1~~GHVL01042305.1.p1  ORF type:complete len:154 (+),score=0.57 GHVL01042305.1:104-565(+)